MYFTVGQTVEALTTNTRLGIEKDKKYIINWEYTCSCGVQFVAWGDQNRKLYRTVSCYRCKEVFDRDYHVICPSTLFQPVILDSLEKAFVERKKE